MTSLELKVSIIMGLILILSILLCYIRHISRKVTIDKSAKSRSLHLLRAEYRHSKANTNLPEHIHFVFMDKDDNVYIYKEYAISKLSVNREMAAEWQWKRICAIISIYYPNQEEFPSDFDTFEELGRWVERMVKNKPKNTGPYTYIRFY